jgi:A-factor type gamma-butyrolactone 1'-reductase (1S-forming)
MTYLQPPPLPVMARRLQDRVVLVTGASSGIGEAAVRLFAAEGAKVVAVARRRERIDALAHALTAEGREVAATVCDVRDENSVAGAVTFALERFGRLDGAFNNAGVGGVRGPVHTLARDALDAPVTSTTRSWSRRAITGKGGGWR